VRILCLSCANVSLLFGGRQLGDPTASGSATLVPCPALIQAVSTALNDDQHHAAAGYVNALGLPAAREAIATLHSSSSWRLHADQVVVANGCSGALELALTALLDVDSILLVPQPGFPLYQVISESHGARVVPYRLRPDHDWRVDLDHLDAVLRQYHANHNVVRALVLNNPSNPTGAVYSAEHLREIVSLCDAYHLPIVADEVYGDLVLDPAATPFVPLAHVAAELGRRVPVITASGIGKQYLLPGWRVGWICFQDK
jgi:tyrosine aminotransferase